MALAVDSQMPSGAAVHTTSNTSPWTWSFTNTAGTVLYLLLMFDNGTQHPTPTVTYAGTSMTLLGTRQSDATGGAGTANIYLFRLTSPATGANNFAVTFTGGTSLVAGGAAISLTGNAATPDNGTATLNSYSTTGTNWPLTVSSTSTGNIVVMGAIYGDQQGSSFSQTGTLSARADWDSSAFGNNTALQYQSSSAGSTSTSFTGTLIPTSWVTVGIQVLAAAGATVDQIMATMNQPTNTPMFQKIGIVAY